MKNTLRPRTAAQEAADELHRQRVDEKARAHDQLCADMHEQYQKRATILREAKRVLGRPLLPEELDALLPPIPCWRTEHETNKAERQVLE